MRYHFHLLTGITLDYDFEGREFSNLAAARLYGARFLETYVRRSAPDHVQRIKQMTLCITDANGKMTAMPFAHFVGVQPGGREGLKRAA